MYIPEYFKIQELVTPAVYGEWQEFAWTFLDDRLLMTLDDLREEFGPLIVNTWHSETLRKAYGLRMQSGLRDHLHYDSIDDYLASMSQHKFGRAADCLFQKQTVSFVRHKILESPEKYSRINGIELNVTWLHFDVGNREHITTF